MRAGNKAEQRLLDIPTDLKMKKLKSLAGSPHGYHDTLCFFMMMFSFILFYKVYNVYKYNNDYKIKPIFILMWPTGHEDM